MRLHSLAGTWNADIGDGRVYRVSLPGTLDENGIGYADRAAGSWHPDAAVGNRTGLFDTGDVISTRLTRKYTYEGPVRFSKTASIFCQPGDRLFLEMERARCPRLFIDGEEILPRRKGSLSTPYVFELTGTVQCTDAAAHKQPEAGTDLQCTAASHRKREASDDRGDGHEIIILTDNSYPGLPRKDILCSSAASDETQTNWNGILGYLRLREESAVFLSDLVVYACETVPDPEAGPASGTAATADQAGLPLPDGSDKKAHPPVRTLTVRVTVDAAFPCRAGLAVSSEALQQPVACEIVLPQGLSTHTLANLPVREDLRLWDLDEGNLYTLTAGIVPKAPDTKESRKTVRFGVRFFGNDGHGHLALNHRRIFLRCETNCAVFPETGYSPMDCAAWKAILDSYRSYGVNCVRFHSHCPPEAAFEAADEMGMLMYPELSNWNPVDAFETEENFACYRTELEQITGMLANHPSFVMLSLGNELFAGEKGHGRMNELLFFAHRLDPTRLYAEGSNVHYGDKDPEPESDFYTAMAFHGKDLRAVSDGMRGYLNRDYPDTCHDYAQTVGSFISSWKKPVFGFEAGQYQSLPDFKELKSFHGVTAPDNYRLIEERVQERGLKKVWPEYVRASGELALLCYREEAEAALRTEDMSGIAVLGLQDFPGQGTALIGMMDAHLQPKPYAFADPRRFRAFFTDVLPMAEFERYTWIEGQMLEVGICLANYGRKDLEGSVVCRLGSLERGKSKNGYGRNPLERDVSGSEARDGKDFEEETSRLVYPAGQVTRCGAVRFRLPVSGSARRLELELCINGYSNSYPIWVYPDVKPVCPEDIHETEHFDGEARRVLQNGGTVYLSPPSTREALPSSVQAQFSTDFWSIGSFPEQAGTMGQLINAAHPLFADFPTEFYTNWQWWIMASKRAAVLPEYFPSIITEMDSYARLAPMAQLLECRCLQGRVLFSTLGLQELGEYPEAAWLQRCIYRYMCSDAFKPEGEMDPQVLESLVP